MIIRGEGKFFRRYCLVFYRKGTIMCIPSSLGLSNGSQKTGILLQDFSASNEPFSRRNNDLRIARHTFLIVTILEMNSGGHPMFYDTSCSNPLIAPNVAQALHTYKTYR